MRFMTKEGKEAKEAIQWIAKTKCKKCLKGDVEIRITYYFEKNNRDLLGSSKCMMDAMQGIVYENDRQIKKASLEMFKDKDNPRVEIEIIENV